MTRPGTLALAALMIFAGAAACKAQADKPAAAPSAAALATEEDKTLYALGLAVGRNVAELGLSKAEVEVVKRGFGDAATGAKAEVDLQVYGPKIREMAQGRASKKAEAEKAKAVTFIDQATKEAGAVKTPSGLVFVELAKGTGPTPKPTDTVKVHYKGTLIDGTEFDSSYKRNEPTQFPLSGVIPCWTEGVQRLAVGGKAKLICPSSIAYGDQGRPPTIPGGATLVFEVELIEIVVASAKPPAPSPPVR